MAFSTILGYFTSFIPGFRLIDGGELALFAQLQCSAGSGIVAHAGGGQASATALPYAMNEVSTVASSADSVLLPLALPGARVEATNSGANDMQVFGQVSNPQNANVGDRIIPYNSSSAAATGTGVSQAANKAAIYFCHSIGVWKQMLTG